MACLTVPGLDQNIPCGAPPIGQLSRPVSAKLISASRVASFSIAGSGIGLATITLSRDYRAVYLEAANNALVVNLAMKGGEVYPQQNDVSIEATLYGTGIGNLANGRANTGGMNGQYIIAVDHGNGVYKVYGLGAPLEVLSVEGSSTGNGFVRTTFGVEDWQTGTTIYDLSKADYDALSIAVPTGGK